MAAIKKPNLFHTWKKNDEQGKQAAMDSAFAGYLQLNKNLQQAKAAATFKNISSPNTSIRDGMDRGEYDYFRPNEAIPTDDQGIIGACMQAYKKFAIVRNIIDLMSDFAVKGIDIVHPNPKVQEFGLYWFKKVRGKAVSERLASMLLRAAAGIVRKGTAKLPDTTMDVLREKKLAAKASTEVKFETVNSGLASNEIPLSYTILHPLTLEVVGGELAPFLGKDKFRYAVKLPQRLHHKVSKLSKAEKELWDDLPKDIKDAFKNGEKTILLDKAKTAAVYYKRDDWQVWPTPMLYPLLDSLSLYDKMRLADRAALDGAISHVRLWKLGSLEERIFPGPDVINQLADMLINNTGGGSMDLIWGPDIDFKETDSKVHEFLGIEKYAEVLEAIYQGLGIPPSMTGSSGSSGGFTNNVVSLNTLIERLEYVRSVIVEFWEAELAIIQEVFGFRKPFTLTFDTPNLTDQTAIYKLLIDLMDRNVVSDEFVLEKFGALPEIEKLRVNREQQERDSGRRQPKASQYHEDSTLKSSHEKMFVQQGVVAPSEVGVNLKQRKEGEDAPVEKNSKLKIKEVKAAPKPAPGAAPTAKKKVKKSDNGRPKGTKDTGKRKTKKVNPRTRAFLETNLWSTEALQAISNLTQPVYLKAKGKQNLRQLSTADAESFEKFKFCVLCSLEPLTPVTEETIQAALQADLALPVPVDQLFKATVAKYLEQKGEAPTMEKTRQIQAAVAALYTCDLGEEETDGENCV